MNRRDFLWGGSAFLAASSNARESLTAFWRSNGDYVSRLDDPEPILNRTPPGGLRDTTTPAAMAQSLRRFVLGRVLSEPSRAMFTAWLVGCQTGDNRLRAGLPTTWQLSNGV